MNIFSKFIFVRTLKPRLALASYHVRRVFYLLVFLLVAGLNKANAAEIYVNTVYKGIGTTYGAETQSIQISASTLVAGRNFRFISLDQQDPGK